MQFKNKIIIETIPINIKNPKAKKLITDLADLDLIEINDSKKNIKDYLIKVRSSVVSEPTLEEITEIVEQVREERFKGKD